jgi:hypothetical protein
MATKKKTEVTAPIDVFKFRVIVDTEIDVFRDIEIDAKQNFSVLHQAILGAFQFTEGEMASFYLSDENWEKGMEIPLMDMGEGEICMDNTVISEMAKTAGDKILYVYDFMRMWIFYVELLEVKSAALSGSHQVVLAFGEAPNQEEKEMEMMFDDLMVEDTLESAEGEGEEEEDEFGFGDDEHFDSNEFDGYYEER